MMTRNAFGILFLVFAWMICNTQAAYASVQHRDDARIEARMLSKGAGTAFDRVVTTDALLLNSIRLTENSNTFVPGSKSLKKHFLQTLARQRCAFFQTCYRFRSSQKINPEGSLPIYLFYRSLVI